MDPGTYVDVVAAAIDDIAVAATGNLDAAVEHCPGWDVGRLLEHTGGFCRVVAGRVARDEEWVPSTGRWQDPPVEAVAGDPIGWHRRRGAELVDALRGSRPDEAVTTFAGPRTRYFWYRRAAHELTVHRWDAESARGRSSVIDPAIAVDGIDELLGELGPRAATLLQGAGETYQFVVEDVGPSFTVTAEPERLVSHTRRAPDVVARAGASILLRFLWGRAAPADLHTTGDSRLLDRWHERVRL
jgi:uncharacterized protein (TIGR03083 family)